MFESIVYAKKLVLPSLEANSIQTLQMAAAFSELAEQQEIRLFFYPGLRVSRDSRHLKQFLAGLGIEPETAVGWQSLSAWQRGLYGLNFRCNILKRLCARQTSLYYARDVGEAGFISRMRGRPLLRGRGLFLFEMHEVLFKQWQAAGDKRWPGIKKLEQTIMDAVDGLVVINPALADEARDYFDYRKPVLVAPSCYNEHLFKPVNLFSAENPWPAADTDSRIGLVYVGSISENKGTSELLKAMRLLPERFHLTILGRGSKEYTAELKKLRQSIPNWENRIHFAGFVPQADLQEICGTAHISIIPQQSEEEFFSPMKLNESLALGLPVVATPLKIFDSVAEFTHTARDCSPQALAEAIAELAANPERARELRQRGLSEAGQYTWENRARRIFDFAQSLPYGRA